jgi:hypothetical protein
MHRQSSLAPASKLPKKQPSFAFFWFYLPAIVSPARIALPRVVNAPLPNANLKHVAPLTRLLLHKHLSCLYFFSRYINNIGARC